MDARPGDKVRFTNETNYGDRGVIQKATATNIIIRLDESGELVRVPFSAVTNFSLAARKAWESMPHRRVGRPKGTATTDRLSVTLRIDRELWEKFKHAEEAGLITDRTATINAWIAEKLSQIEKSASGANGD
jgi:hypothetical protein